MHRNTLLGIHLMPYIKEGHSKERIKGFSDGFKKAQDLQLLQTDVSNSFQCVSEQYDNDIKCNTQCESCKNGLQNDY